VVFLPGVSLGKESCEIHLEEPYVIAGIASAGSQPPARSNEPLRGEEILSLSWLLVIKHDQLFSRVKAGRQSGSGDWHT
jgi:hypothetical protein